MTKAPAVDTRKTHSRAFAIAIAIAMLLVSAGLLWLGIWQVQRRAWKLDLIARVEQRITAAPQAAPSPADWPTLTVARDSYRRVEASGVLLADRSVLTQAVTVLGAGYWVMTPLRTDAGFNVFINRGFIQTESRGLAFSARFDGNVHVVGLLRMTEPRGGFLHTNVPADDRWYSRDISAMAAKIGLHHVAPYFVDAAAGLEAVGPIGGLTVVSFKNNHLIYAITWFVLSAMTLVGAIRILKFDKLMK